MYCIAWRTIHAAQALHDAQGGLLDVVAGQRAALLELLAGKDDDDVCVRVWMWM